MTKAWQFLYRHKNICFCIFHGNKRAEVSFFVFFVTGLIKLVSKHHAQLIYTRATKAADEEAGAEEKEETTKKGKKGKKGKQQQQQEQEA